MRDPWANRCLQSNSECEYSTRAVKRRMGCASLYRSGGAAAPNLLTTLHKPFFNQNAWNLCPSNEPIPQALTLDCAGMCSCAMLARR
ncbi:hypothetical protein BN2476_520105 [Paraburkholderia piptadeniae]|uniref:Uncharacterized protein n=1 Tax=Paraburkholderia piptadeniae TaxID=1701573 RepID=A0A1N7SH87_9BURK|nr:hypothetical protein BN2476_520105 [Paraburkholderia piptadeniae]